MQESISLPEHNITPKPFSVLLAQVFVFASHLPHDDRKVVSREIIPLIIDHKGDLDEIKKAVAQGEGVSLWEFLRYRNLYIDFLHTRALRHQFEPVAGSIERSEESEVAEAIENFVEDWISSKYFELYDHYQKRRVWITDNIDKPYPIKIGGQLYSIYHATHLDIMEIIDKIGILSGDEGNIPTGLLAPIAISPASHHIITTERYGEPVKNLPPGEVRTIPDKHVSQLMEVVEFLHERDAYINYDPKRVNYDKERGFLVLDFKEGTEEKVSLAEPLLRLVHIVTSRNYLGWSIQNNDSEDNQKFEERTSVAVPALLQFFKILKEDYEKEFESLLYAYNSSNKEGLIREALKLAVFTDDQVDELLEANKSAGDYYQTLLDLKNILSNQLR